MAVTQRERAEVPPSHRSILPSVPGIPAGGAVAVAVTCALIGFAIDARGGDELTGTFATLYVIGCLLAALAVRYRGLFTTMVLPPLLLFLAVPVAYQLMLGNSGSLKIKDILLNLAIPLVNRFPTMALATVLVLIVGAVRVTQHRREQHGDSSGTAGRTRARVARPTGAARAQRARTAGTKEPARRRFRSNAAEQDDSDAPEATPAAGRRPAGRVAARPPRVGGADRQSSGGADKRSSGGADRQAAPGQAGANRQPPGNRQAPGDRKRTPPGDRKAQGERKPPADRKPQGERKPPPDRRAADRANPAANPAAEPRRRRAANPEVPPHPRPNVRYRERDSGRIER